MVFRLFLKFLILLMAVFMKASGNESVLYVDCDHGSDSNAGTLAAPFLTLTKARDTLRTMQPLQAPATVNVLTSDCYPRDATGAVNFSVPVLELEAEDSGTSSSHITYTAMSGSNARILAGAPIPASAWTLHSPGIYKADLSSAGLNLARWGLGSLASGGLGQCEQTLAELFFNGSAMTIARWPNIDPNGGWHWTNILNASASTPLSFTSNETRLLNWAKEQAPWLHGFWEFDWADSYVKVDRCVCKRVHCCCRCQRAHTLVRV